MSNNITINNVKITITEDQADDIVIASLMETYDLYNQPNKIDNTVNEYIEPDEALLYCFATVLEAYMRPADYKVWVETKKGKPNE